MEIGNQNLRLGDRDEMEHARDIISRFGKQEAIKVCESAIVSIVNEINNLSYYDENRVCSLDKSRMHYLSVISKIKQM